MESIIIRKQIYDCGFDEGEYFYIFPSKESVLSAYEKIIEENKNNENFEYSLDRDSLSFDYGYNDDWHYDYKLIETINYEETANF